MDIASDMPLAVAILGAFGIIGLPILVVAWFLFPKKERKREPDVARKVETFSESRSTTVFIAED